MAQTAELLDAHAVARLLGCSTRHVYRLKARGVMPEPVRMGPRFVRWPRQVLLEWIARGCPAPEVS